MLDEKVKIHAKFPHPEKFASALVDIYSVSHPQLTVIDGYLCQEGNGPSAGDVIELDLMLVGFDPVALDTTVCNIIAIDPKKVFYIAKAAKKNLGTTDLS